MQRETLLNPAKSSMERTALHAAADAEDVRHERQVIAPAGEVAVVRRAFAPSADLAANATTLFSDLGRTYHERELGISRSRVMLPAHDRTIPQPRGIRRLRNPLPLPIIPTIPRTNHAETNPCRMITRHLTPPRCPTRSLVHRRKMEAFLSLRLFPQTPVCKRATSSTPRWLSACYRNRTQRHDL